jgi:hypothetical protein
MCEFLNCRADFWNGTEAVPYRPPWRGTGVSVKVKPVVVGDSRLFASRKKKSGTNVLWGFAQGQ